MKHLTRGLSTLVFSVLILTGLMLQTLRSSGEFSAKAQSQVNNPTVQENSLPGATGWQKENLHFSTNTQAPIMGYASETSINHGQAIDLHVSTTSPTYTIEIYRVGYYQGKGARLLSRVSNLAGAQQPIPSPDPVTGMVDANWPVSYTLQTTNDWVSGAYLAKLVASDGNSNFIQFVVRDDESPADILFQIPITTEQAYNGWGGKSLYDYNSGGSRASHVSFNRPYDRNSGSGDLLTTQYGFIRFMESKGYHVAYATNVDTHRSPQLMANKKVFFSNWHDEYWSKEMRDNVTAARDSGKSLTFFDANNIYYQIRFEPSSSGVANRTIVSYKDANRDPMSTVNPSLTTVRWRDTPVSQPENALLGIMFEAMVPYESPYPLLVTNASHWVYADTGLQNGDTIPGIVGYEYDKVFNNGLTPTNLEILAATPLHNHEEKDSTSHMTIYQHSSGGYVFAAGTMFWFYKIDNNDYSWHGVDTRLTKITTNIFDRMISSAGTPNPSPVPTPVVTPSPSIVPTPSVTPTPSVSPSPSATPAPEGYPRELSVRTANSHPGIKVFEVQPSVNNKYFLKLEVSPTIPAYQVDWYVNGRWSTQDATAPYYLGGDTASGPKGYTLATTPATIRAVVYYNGWNYHEATVTFTPDSGTGGPTPAPTPTLTPTPSPTPTPTPLPSPSPTPTVVPSPSVTPTPVPSPVVTPSPSVVPTPSPTPSPTVAPTPSPTPEGYPRQLSSTNAKIKIFEVKPPQNNRVFVKIEVDPSVSAYQVDWYINKRWSTQDKTVPYYLGGDTVNGPNGYLLSSNPSEIRPVVYYSGWNFIDAFTSLQF